MTTKKRPTIEVTTPTERELRWARHFNAPVHRVFEALTKPELVKRWLLGPEGWVMAVCEIDLRPAGAYRYVLQRKRDGKAIGVGGVFEEVRAPTLVRFTEVFDEAWYSGHALGTYELEQTHRGTRLIQTMCYESRRVRDEILQSGFEDGIDANFNRLDEMLAR